MSMRSKRRLFCTLLAVSTAFMSGVPIAAAQGIPAPGANQAFLYEMDEDAVLLNSAGHVLVPNPSGKSPTGLAGRGDTGFDPLLSSAARDRPR